MSEEEYKIRKVLVADDDDLLLGMYRTKFEDKGVEMLTARNGQQALEILRQNDEQIDCLVLDVIMPDLNGLDVLETARQEDLIGRRSVVILSNQGAGRDIARAKELGIQGYIVKATSTPGEAVDQVIEIDENFKRKNS